MVGLFLGGLVVGIVAVWAAIVAQPTVAGLTGAYCLAPRCYCDGTQFEAAVHQGPDAGFEVEGAIKYAVSADGTFTVQIRGNKGEQVHGTGQAVGRSLDMVLVLPDDRHIFAHGSLDDDLRKCNGGAAGPLTGPVYGDIGDWGSRYPPYIRTISGSLN
jgi:hypothetical protein